MNPYSLQDISKALHAPWSADTAYDPKDWSEDNKARGQCVVSSLIMQDYFGGELIRYEINKASLHETHYANILNGVVIDTTASQYKNPVTMRVKPANLKNFASLREKLLADDSTKRRYGILKAHVEIYLTTLK